jgi:LPXTG-motif cell wall-anchored protein
MRYQPMSLLDRLVAGCVSLLVAAIALYIAVHLIESIWPVLVAIGLGVAAVAGLVLVLRRRRQGW